MTSKYFNIVKDFKSSSNASYNLERTWNIKEISGYENANGYKVQKISFQSNIAGATDDYYEEWKVINGRCERNGQEYDDHFTFDAGLISFEDLENISTAFFKYKSQIFWVDIKSDIYEEISTWSKRNVIMAGDLQAIYVHDCNIDFGEPLETYSYNREYNFK